MEDQNSVFKPQQTNPDTTSPNLPSSPVSDVGPIAAPSSKPVSSSPQSPVSWTPDSSSGKGSMFGRLSLLLSSLAVGIFLLLIFVTSLIDSLTKTYIWFFVILALGVAGFVLGLLSEKGKDKISLLGLVGIIISTIVCINCLVVGSYYLKIQMELNKFQEEFNSSSSSTTDFNFDDSGSSTTDYNVDDSFIN